MGAYKSAVTKRLRPVLADPSAAVWQRGYHEHIVRAEKALDNIREYIAENPRRWSEDPENSAVVP